MGLLDALQFGGGSGGGGLLDFLRQMQPQQDSFSGLPANQAQYGQPMPTGVSGQMQPSPLDSAQWPYGPNGAPSQANTQMQPQQPPPLTAQPPQPQGPGVGDRLGAGFQSFANSGGPLQAIVNGIGGAITGQRMDDHGIAQQQQKQVQNQTLQWLLKRGADPIEAQAAIGNPKVLESLIEQLKPKALISTGSGHLYDPNTKSDIKTYDPEDRIPAGFRKSEDGNLEFIPNGPADPSYLRLKAAKEKDPNGVYTLGRGGELYKIDKAGNPVVVHKNEAAQPEATLDEPTVKAMAAQYLAGDKSVMQNLGRGAQGAANIVELRKEIYGQANAQGLNSKDIVNTFNEQAGNLAGQRSIGTRAANISLAANEANNMIPIALKASEAVPRTQYMPLNQAIQAVQKGNSSPELARFVAATNSLVNAYVRAVSPSGVPTDSMREHAYSMLNSAQSHQAYTAVTSIMQDEMKAALQAPEQVRKELRGGAERPRESQGQSGDAIYAQAKDAIAKGAPREKVLERLRQNGVDASGL